LLRQVLWNGVFFGLIGCINDFRATHEVTSPGSSPRTSRMLDSFLTGLVAGSLATLCNTPLDVAKTRLQVCSVDSWGSKAPPWSLHVVWQIYREEGGLRACFKGLNARLYRAAPGSGILILAHDQIMSRLQS
jgi:solute carrier family 25 2-oxodicarboxylate transporter 21